MHDDYTGTCSFANVFQVFERPTQRPVSTSPLIVTESKKANKRGKDRHTVLQATLKAGGLHGLV
jgi:hypothetical protein